MFTEPWSEFHILVAEKADVPQNPLSTPNGSPHGLQSPTQDSTLTCGLHSSDENKSRCIKSLLQEATEGSRTASLNGCGEETGKNLLHGSDP